MKFVEILNRLFTPLQPFGPIESINHSTIYFSRNKSANNNLHGFSEKRTDSTYNSGKKCCLLGDFYCCSGLWGRILLRKHCLGRRSLSLILCIGCRLISCLLFVALVFSNRYGYTPSVPERINSQDACQSNFLKFD